MIKILLITVAILAICMVIFILLWRSAKNKQKDTQRKLTEVNKELSEAVIYQAKLESTIEILKKNRSEADEKINKLHNGNTTGNALNELRKRKN